MPSAARQLVVGSASLVLLLAATGHASDFPGLGPRGDLVRIEFEPGQPKSLVGRNARQQLVVTGVYTSGQRHDLTHSVKWSVDAPEVVEVSETGLLTPRTDGTATVTASGPADKAVQMTITTVACNQERAVHFVNEIVPVFTKLGCNAGGCHGKADGQNGFRLSLLGFYPDDDYEYLVHEDRGRRLFPADPEYSLLMLKPANQLPHGGGRRMTPGSYEWQLVASWIRQGMPYGSDEDAVLEGIKVFPPVREMNTKTAQQVSVVGYYSDGTQRDVTRLASYEANDPEMADADPDGRITVADKPGDAAVMVRFQGQVGVFRAVIPQGLPVANLPPRRTLVDAHVFARLKQLGIPPSELCDDATFLRRVTLDITGQLPTLEDAQQFLDDTSRDKRDRLVDRLISSAGYSDYFANKWAAVLRNKRRNNNDIPFTYRFHSWIRQRLAENMPYDEFVRSVLTATGDAETHPPVAWYREVRTSTARMEDTAQLFLGLRLGCAKCHHHPFERWSQQDYYGFEAFFSQVGQKVGRFNAERNRPDVVYLNGRAPVSRNPRSQQNVQPTPLGGEPLDIQPWDDARHALVDWMAEPDNPFFARALVNRYWKHFFGRGIVDPEDDLRVTNPPSNPELLDALATHFVDSGYDLQELVRTICKSSAYQLSAEPTELNLADRQSFSSFYPRRMPAEVLFDAVCQTAGVPTGFRGLPDGTTAVQLPDNGFNNYFLRVFGKPEAESACECERNPEANLAQSLHLLNSTDVQGRLQNGNGRAARLAADQERSDEDKITELYYRAFSRPPQRSELEFVVGHIAAATNKRLAYEDLLWAMFNAKEFQFIR